MSDKWNLIVLKILSESDQPMGSWNIAEEITEQGIEVSTATIGRVLKQLEKAGYLKKENVRGRMITEKGLNAIKSAAHQTELNHYHDALKELVNSNTLNNYLQVLEARKAIERSTVALAAENITDKELKNLEKIVKKQISDRDKGLSIALDDIDFHLLIAKASRNEALLSLYMILSKMGQQSELFEKLREKVGEPYNDSHLAIFTALANHDSASAEAALIRHIDILKEDVNKYWHIYAI